MFIDAHADTITRAAGASPVDLSMLLENSHWDLHRAKDGRVVCQVMAMCTCSRDTSGCPAKSVLEMIDAAHLLASAHPDKTLIALNSSDILRAAREGKVAMLLSIENGLALEGSVRVLRNFYRLGVRAMGLTWHYRNDIADGIAEEHGKSGLTVFGTEVVKEMQTLGMVVDVSHMNIAGFWDVLEKTKGPVIASHSNARVVCKHARNLYDDQIKALAARGGVMGINFCADFLSDSGNTSLDDIVKHIDHIVSLAGPGCVGLGSDFDGIPKPPEKVENVSKLPVIAEELLRKGYKEADVRKISGENFFRVFREVLG